MSTKKIAALLIGLALLAGSVGGIVERALTPAGHRLGAFPSFPATGGGGVTSVTTDATLTGAGTIASPLGINPVAALGPDWFGYMAAFFSQKTNLTALQWSVINQSDFANNGTDPLACWGNLKGGTGSACTQPATLTVGGVMKLVGPTTIASESSWLGSLGQSNTMGNMRTKRWAVCARWSLGTTPLAAFGLSVGMYNTDYVGLGFLGAATNLQYVRGNSGFLPVNRVDTGSALVVDSTGATGYRTTCVGNFDNVSVSYVVDMAVSNALVTAEPVANLANAAGYPYILNATNAGGNPTIFLDKVFVAAQL